MHSMKDFGQKTLFYGCESLENRHICMFKAFLSFFEQLTPAKYWYLSETLHWVHSLPWNLSQINLRLISDKVNQVFFMMAAFSLIFQCIFNGNFGVKSSGTSGCLKFMKKFRGCFYMKRNQDLELQLDLPILVHFGTPYSIQQKVTGIP